VLRARCASPYRSVLSCGTARSLAGFSRPVAVPSQEILRIGEPRAASSPVNCMGRTASPREPVISPTRKNVANDQRAGGGRSGRVCGTRRSGALLPFPWVGFHDRPSRAVK